MFNFWILRLVFLYFRILQIKTRSINICLEEILVSQKYNIHQERFSSFILPSITQFNRITAKTTNTGSSLTFAVLTVKVLKNSSKKIANLWTGSFKKQQKHDFHCTSKIFFEIIDMLLTPLPPFFLSFFICVAKIFFSKNPRRVD